MEDTETEAALSLSPAMILGLLKELSGMDNPLVVQFCNILADHPVSRTSRAPSIGPSTASICQPSVPTSSGASALDEPTLVAETTSTASETTPQLSSLETNNDQEESSNVTCCRNGVKRTNLQRASYNRQKILSGASAATGNAGVGRQGLRRGKRAVHDPDVMVMDEGKKIGEIGVGEDGEVGLGEVSGESSEDSDYGSCASGGKRKRHSRKDKKNTRTTKLKGPPSWMTNGTPPALFEGTDDILMELSRILSNTGLQSLVDFTQLLIHPDSSASSDTPELKLGSLIAACVEQESKRKLADFRHMVLLIRLSFHMDR
jgi:hypothetical protein